MGRPRVCGGVEMSKSNFIRIPQEAQLELERQATEEGVTMTVIFRRHLCAAAGYTKTLGPEFPTKQQLEQRKRKKTKTARAQPAPKVGYLKGLALALRGRSS